jgi:hypothetical protein
MTRKPIFALLLLVIGAALVPSNASARQHYRAFPIGGQERTGTGEQCAGPAVGE